MKSELLGELTAASDNLRRSHLDRLYGMGVPRRSLFDFERGLAGYFGVTPIEPHGDGTYEPAETGRGAFVMAVLVAPGVLEDLIAFRPDDPGRWWCRHGIARFLNEDAIFRAMGCKEPLMLWRSPFHWLREECQGTVVLDWGRGLPLLRDVGEIGAEDVSHGNDIERRLQERRGPRITVPRRVA